MAAVSLRKRRKIRILQLGRADSPRIIALLMHTDGAVHAVVDDDDDDWQLVLDGGRKLLPIHEEAAVSRKGDNRPLREKTFGCYRRGGAVAYRSRGRGQLGGAVAVAVEAMHPSGVVARTIAEDAFRRQPLPQPGHDLAHLHIAWHCRWRRPGQIVFSGPLPLLAPAGLLVRLYLGQRSQRRADTGVDGEGGLINPPQLFCAGIDMDQLLLWPRDVDQRVAAGGHLPEPRADHQ